MQWPRAVAALVAAVVLCAFTALIVVRLAQGRRPVCACFGALSARPIGAATVGAEATRYAPALRLAQSILAQSAMPRKEVVLVSDFQKLGWEKQEDIRLPEGATITPVSVAGGQTPDVAVTSVTFATAQFSGQDRVTATVGVVNRGAAAVAEATPC